MESFGQLVRRHRRNGNLTLTYLAASLGVSGAYLSHVERGIKGPLGRGRWPFLIAELPGLTVAELQEGVGAYLRLRAGAWLLRECRRWDLFCARCGGMPCHCTLIGLDRPANVADLGTHKP